MGKGIRVQFLFNKIRISSAALVAASLFIASNAAFACKDAKRMTDAYKLGVKACKKANRDRGLNTGAGVLTSILGAQNTGSSQQDAMANAKNQARNAQDTSLRNIEISRTEREKVYKASKVVSLIGKADQTCRPLANQYAKALLQCLQNNKRETASAGKAAGNAMDMLGKLAGPLAQLGSAAAGMAAGQNPGAQSPYDGSMGPMFDPAVPDTPISTTGLSNSKFVPSPFGKDQASGGTSYNEDADVTAGDYTPYGGDSYSGLEDGAEDPLGLDAGSVGFGGIGAGAGSIGGAGSAGSVSGGNGGSIGGEAAFGDGELAKLAEEDSNLRYSTSGAGGGEGYGADMDRDLAEVGEDFEIGEDPDALDGLEAALLEDSEDLEKPVDIAGYDTQFAGGVEVPDLFLDVKTRIREQKRSGRISSL